jgi:transcriptional regulator with XRE-family HTH domain
MRNEQLIRARTQRGWNHAEVAEKIGTYPHLVKAWEQGTAIPSKREKEELCELFGLDMDIFKKKPYQIIRRGPKTKRQAQSKSIVSVRNRTGGKSRRMRRGS